MRRNPLANLQICYETSCQNDNRNIYFLFSHWEKNLKLVMYELMGFQNKEGLGTSRKIWDFYIL